MPTLLRIDSGALSGSASVTRRLTGEYVREWQAAHPLGKVLTRDLTRTALTPVDEEWIVAAYDSEAGRSPRQREVLAASDELIAELLAAEEYVFGVPVYNLSIPAVLKLWIDQISRQGKTFSSEGGSPEGLLHGKRATILLASGGVYDEGTPMAALDFAGPYLRAILRCLGVTDVSMVNASGTSGADPERGIRAAVESIRAHLATRNEALKVAISANPVHHGVR